MTSFFAPTQSARADLAPPQLSGSEALHDARIDDEFLCALSDMTDRALCEFLVTCAERQNEARKRGDFDAAHAFHHAECQAIRFINNRQGATA